MSVLTKAVSDQGYKYFDWNVSSGDAGGTTSTSEVYNNVISGIQSHDISVVLQHDIKLFSVNAVEDIIVWGTWPTDIHFFLLLNQVLLYTMV